MSGSLNRRLKIAEAAQGIGSEKKKTFFWRDNPDLLGKSEKRFCEETPDIDDIEIYVFSFGNRNMG